MLDKIRTVCTASVMAVSAIAMPGAALADYPERPVTLVVPQAVGGAGDLAARAFAQIAEKYLGESIRIVNRDGGAGVPGTMSIKIEEPDGYNLLAPMAPFMLSGPVFRDDSPYKTFDFDYLAILEEQPLVLVTKSGSDYETTEALFDAMRSGEIRTAVGAKISLANLAYLALLKDIGDAPAAAIPYKSGPDSVRGLLAGDVVANMVNLSSASAALQSGDAKLMLVSTGIRNPAYSNVPTAVELNLPTLATITLWTGLAGPSGLPEEVHRKWADVVTQVVADPDYQRLVNQRGSEVVGLTGDALMGSLTEQLESFEALKSALGQ